MASFDLNQVPIYRVNVSNRLIIGFDEDGKMSQTVSLAEANQVYQNGTFTANDDNGDGLMQMGETASHDNPNIGSNPMPDVEDAVVRAVGYMSAPDGSQVTVFLLADADDQYLVFPDGSPAALTNLPPNGTLNATFTFFEEGRFSPDTGFVPCFTRGTMIRTDRGEVAVEDLAQGDLVLTADHGPQPIRWVGSRTLSPADLADAETLRPIRIRAGALGDNTPHRDLLVSPQHRVLVRSKIAQKMFGTDEILVAAKQLCQIDGIDIAEDVATVDYFHILFDRHEVVFSDGAETESLYTGPEALGSIGPAALEEIFAIFPDLRDMDYAPVAARPLATGRMGRKLAVRHAQNGRALVA